MRAKVQAHFPANRYPIFFFEVEGMLRVVDFS